MAFVVQPKAAVAGIALLAVVASGVGLYYFMTTKGSPAPAAAPTTRQAPAPAPGPMGGAAPSGKPAPSMDQLADRLAKRLEQQGGTAEEWALLARSYIDLKQYDAADRAFARAIDGAPDDGKLKADRAAAQQLAKQPGPK